MNVSLVSLRTTDGLTIVKCTYNAFLMKAFMGEAYMNH